MPELKAGSGIDLSYDSQTGDLTVSAQPMRLTFTVQSSDGATPIAAGVKAGRGVAPTAGTLKGWRLISNAPTSAVVRVWKAGASPVLVTGTAPPTLSADDDAAGSVLTGWVTAVAAGDIFYFEVVSNTAASFITLILEAE